MNRALLAATFLAAISGTAEAACAHTKGAWSDKVCDAAACISMKLQIRSVAKDCKTAQVTTSMVHSKFPNKPFGYKGPARISGDKITPSGGKPYTRTADGYTIKIDLAGMPIAFNLR